MTTETNKALERRLTDALNARDWETVRELVAPELVSMFVESPWLVCFPDIQIVTEDMVAEGDKVASRWTDHGTHLGEYQGIAPTGRRVSVAGISIDRIENGKVVESWLQWDEMGLLQQLK